MKTITLKETAGILLGHDDYLILMHKSPDGDTIGSAYALCLALRKLGKRADTLCGDEIPPMYGYFTDKAPNEGFEPKFIISTDVASTTLLSGKAEEYKDNIDLCIDHHASNTGFAAVGYVDGKASSCAEIIKYLLDEMELEYDKDIADAIFTGICTDTGCFKYSSVSPSTHRTAAELMEQGVDSTFICHLMFDCKSKSRILLEKMVLDTLEFHSNGRLAIIEVTKEMMDKSGAKECDTDGIPSMPTQIQGVKIGVTMKEKPGGEYRFSVRTNEGIDASAICAEFGGGGHHGAAGCSINKEKSQAKKEMLSVCMKILGDNI